MRTIGVTTTDSGYVLLDNRPSVTVHERSVILRGGGVFYVHGVQAHVRVTTAPTGDHKVETGSSTDCIVTHRASPPSPRWNALETDAILTLAPFDPVPLPGYACPRIQVAAAAALVILVAFGALRFTTARTPGP